MEDLVSLAQEAVKADMEQRTYYWNGGAWVNKAEYFRTAKPVGMFTFRGSVPSFDKLPTEGNALGDQYIVEADTLTIGLTTAPGILITGAPTLSGVLHSTIMETGTLPTLSDLTDRVLAFVLGGLRDGSLALVQNVNDPRDVVLMKSTAFKAGKQYVAVEPIEVNRLSTETSVQDGVVATTVTYNDCQVYIDGSAY